MFVITEAATAKHNFLGKKGNNLKRTILLSCSDCQEDTLGLPTHAIFKTVRQSLVGLTLVLPMGWSGRHISVPKH